MELTIPGIPVAANWRNQPESWEILPDQRLIIKAGERTDLFLSPSGDLRSDNSPAALFMVPEKDFILSAKVTVNFHSAYDAGVLLLHITDTLWGKLCFEFSPQRQPMIVSVVTRGLSDDCNSQTIDGNTVYLRIARIREAIAFHYSLDGYRWHFARFFTLGRWEHVWVGFSSQSPTGDGCTAEFSDIHYQEKTLGDLRNGS